MTSFSANIVDQLECHDRVVHHGLETLLVPKEIESIFGTTNVDHFISGFGSKRPAPTWNSVAYFLGRYRLTFRMPIGIDYAKCRVSTTTGSPAFLINEVVEAYVSKSVIAGATMQGQWLLNENDWKLLVKSKCDWSIVRVPILTNAPVNGFIEFERQQREPIRNRKEGFDKRVKQAFEIPPSENPDSPRTNTHVTILPEKRADDLTKEFSCYENVIRNGVKHLVFPKEVESLFGPTNVDHFISKFGSNTLTPVWHSLTYFDGRYQLLLQVPVSIDYENCKLNGAKNSAVVQIGELITLMGNKSQAAETTIRERWKLNENEWKSLVRNHGDWSAVKIPIVKDSPVVGFSDYVRRERSRPIRERQEVFDKPIRTAVDLLHYPSHRAPR